MRLIRWCISMLALCSLAYFSITVPLGTKTLWQHLQAISKSEESHDLVEGVKIKAHEVTNSSPTHKNIPPTEPLTEEERHLLRKLLRDKLAANPDVSPQESSRLPSESLAEPE